jgi:hypothetical protein
MAAPIPRRPQTPGVPGVRLPRKHAQVAVHGMREVRPLLAPDDDETTLPNRGGAPPESGTVRHAKSLSVNGLSKPEAGQLAGIIAAWEGADDTGRLLLAEFARRVAGSRTK